MSWFEDRCVPHPMDARLIIVPDLKEIERSYRTIAIETPSGATVYVPRKNIHMEAVDEERGFCLVIPKWLGDNLGLEGVLAETFKIVDPHGEG